jgi:hypothetical protein
MKILMGWTGVVTIGMAALMLSGSSALTQRSGTPQLPSTSASPDPFTGGDPATKNRLDGPPMGVSPEAQAMMRNTERQRRLQLDTERLLSLATQLHQDVEKTDPHILSVDVVKRAEEIEKLAHSVKERMKGSV